MWVNESVIDILQRNIRTIWVEFFDLGGVLMELWGFMSERKRFWLLPFIAVQILLVAMFVLA